MNPKRKLPVKGHFYTILSPACGCARIITITNYIIINDYKWI